MSLPIIPVYLASEGFVPPETGTYYLVAKDGIYMRVERLHGWALVKTSEIPFLQSVAKTGKFTLPKISAVVMAQAKTFFESVFAKYHSESYLTLLYSKKLQDYRLWCPTQEVSYSSVNYDRADSVPVEERAYIGADGDGWQPVGTIHSHCDFSAFHSGTDQADESTFDGIHLTFGHVNSKEFSIASSFVFNNNRSEVEPISVALGISNSSEEEVTEEVEKKIRGVTVKKSYSRMEYYYHLELNEEESATLENWKTLTLPQFLSKVTTKARILDSWTSSSNWTANDSKKYVEDWQDIGRSPWLWDRNNRNDKNQWNYGLKYNEDNDNCAFE